MNKYRMSERAVLMRLSAGLPGKHRKDRALSEQVKGEHKLGAKAGGWIKNKYPDWALEPLEKLLNEARAYHAAVTLPFDAGIGILPAALIMEHGNKMREFKYRFEHLAESHFRGRYAEMVEWAKAEHNGTFDAKDYPEVGEVMESFYFKTEPLPVPDAGHFENTVKSLLGVDTETVNIRVADAMIEAQKELLRRLCDPLRAMATKLAEQPKEGKEDIIFRDTLIDNVLEIASLAPKLNISGDPEIDACATLIRQAFGGCKPDVLRKDKGLRDSAKRDAEGLLKRLEGYKL
jgi:hypothetical protein